MDSLELFPETLKTNSNFFKSFPNKRLLSRLRKQVLNYSENFSALLKNHLKNEYEINVRGNNIIPEGCEKLEQLNKEFQILQFENNLKAIIDNCKSFCKSNISEMLLDVVYEELLLSFHNIIRTVQNVVLKERREMDNKLCKENSCRALKFLILLLSKSLKN